MDNQVISLLLIEDIPDDAKYIHNLLARSPIKTFNVIWASNLDEGLHLLSMGGFDVVLLSLNLSGRSTEQNYNRIQNTFPNMPIVPLANISTGTLNIISAIRAGAPDCLLKPELTTTILNQVVTHVIERHHDKNRFRLVIEQVADGIVIVNQSGHILYVNPTAERLFERTAGEMLGTPFGFPLVSGESFEIDILRQNGVPITVDMRVVEIQWDNTVAYLAALRDITDRKLAEERAFELAIQQEKESLLRNFINDTSHDFRTPLSVINTSTYLIKNFCEMENVQHHAEIISKQVNHISELVNKLIDMSRLDDSDELELTDLDVNQVMRQLQKKIARLASQKDIEIRLGLTIEPIYIKGHSENLLDAVQHITKNAILFSPEGDYVSLLTHVDENYAYIDVIDRGPGITEKDLPHIFERFYRGNSARPNTDGNNGLGLSIARKIVELHNGRIDVQTSSGQGSKFSIILPRQA